MRGSTLSGRDARGTAVAVLGVVFGALVAACTGAVGADDEAGGAVGGAGARGGAGGAMGGAPGGGVGGASGVPGEKPVPGACAVDPGAMFLRRLTNTEYRNAVRDLLGADVSDPTTTFPADSIAEGFDNNAEAINISNLHVEKYRAAAEQLAGEVMSVPARRDRVVGCNLAGDRAACVAQFIRAFGRRAYRRPLAPEEVTALTALANGALPQTDPYVGASLVIQGVLSAPSFLFRIEEGRADPAKPGLRKLTGFEVATRLAFLLTGSTPADALLGMAESGALDAPAGVVAAAEGLLRDARAKAAVRNFYAQWLELPMLDHAMRDTRKYTMWSEQLVASMKEETYRLVDDLLWRDGANFLDVLTAPYSYVDARLAKLYGLALTPTAFQRADLAPATQRGGLLTHASLLASTVKNESAIPIHRGKFVRESMLCDRLPPPPDSVPPLPQPVAGQSDQARLEQHRKDPACGGCHALLDPLGFGLARYDMIGAVRTTDSAGQPVTTKGSFAGYTTVDFDGALELERKLRDQEKLPACVVTHFFRFAQARREDAGDACLVATLEQAFKKSGGNLRKMFVDFVASDAFRYRKP